MSELGQELPVEYSEFGSGRFISAKFVPYSTVPTFSALLSTESASSDRGPSVLGILTGGVFS